MKRLRFGIFIPVITCWLTLAIAVNARSGEKVHVVQKGDSIARIADFYGVSQRDLKDANGIGKGSIIDIGDRLVIPDVLRKGARKGHVIKSGDTLVQIARKYKVSVRDLAAANKIKRSSRLTLGKTLVIPGTEDEDYALSEPKEESLKIEGGRAIKGGVLHTVQPGQSIWLIARAYNTSGDRIARRNHIEKARIPKIFNSFYQGRPPQREGETENNGAGLGLTIVKQLLDRCGGSISVSTQVNKGSTFKVLLKTVPDQ